MIPYRNTYFLRTRIRAIKKTLFPLMGKLRRFFFTLRFSDFIFAVRFIL